MEAFEQNIAKTIENISRKQLPKLCSAWIRLFGRKNEDTLHLQLETHYTEFLNSIIKDNLKTEEKLLARLNGLRNESHLIQGQLKEDIIFPDVGETPLFYAVNDASANLDKYRKRLHQKWEEVKALKTEGLALCSELNEATPQSMKHSNNLPTEDELNKILNNLNSLRELKMTRCSIIRKHKQEIKRLMELLEIETDEDLDMNSSDCGSEVVDRLETILFELQEASAKMITEIEGFSARLKLLWNQLNIPEDHQNLFTHHSSNKLKYFELKNELDRCEKLKLEKFPELIENLRAEIIDLSEKCMKGKKFRCRSTAFEVSMYDENMLRRQQVELHQLKSYYHQNRNTFEMISRRDQLKYEMEEMNRQQVDTKSRFNNRGGHLLKEEQGRKALEREILRIEITLCKVVDDYQARYNSPLQVFDEIVQVDRTAKSRLMNKKQGSLKDLRFKNPLGDRTNAL